MLKGSVLIILKLCEGYDILIRFVHEFFCVSEHCTAKIGVLFDGKISVKSACQLEKSGYISAKKAAALGIPSIIEHISHEYKAQAYMSAEMLSLLITQLLIIISRNDNRDKEITPVGITDDFAYVKSFLADNCHRKINMQVLAQYVGYSYDHFRHIFKAATGITPHRYLIDVRLSRAKQLLSHSEDKIDNIALACGFSDCNHFSRVFSQSFGISPTEYRKRYFPL